jgi:hypothetical protein
MAMRTHSRVWRVRRTTAVVRWLLGAVVALGALLAAGRPTRAQTLEAPRHRQGYYVALGVQAGAAKIWEDGEPSWDVWRDRDVGIRAGQLLTRRFGLGLQFLHVGQASGQSQTAGIFGLGFEAQVEVATNLALVGGAGFDVIEISDKTMPKKSSRGTYSSGYSLAMTYDYFLGDRLTGGWSLSPILQTRLIPGGSTTGLTATLGVQLCFWTGLPRNQLDLPLDRAFQKP